MKTLKKCPFCKGKAELMKHECLSTGFVAYYVWHSSNRCPVKQIQTDYANSPAEAIELWNTRIADDED